MLLNSRDFWSKHTLLRVSLTRNYRKVDLSVREKSEILNIKVLGNCKANADWHSYSKTLRNTEKQQITVSLLAYWIFLILLKHEGVTVLTLHPYSNQGFLLLYFYTSTILGFTRKSVLTGLGTFISAYPTCNMSQNKLFLPEFVPIEINWHFQIATSLWFLTLKGQCHKIW